MRHRDGRARGDVERAAHGVLAGCGTGMCAWPRLGCAASTAGPHAVGEEQPRGRSLGCRPRRAAWPAAVAPAPRPPGRPPASPAGCRIAAAWKLIVAGGIGASSDRSPPGAPAPSPPPDRCCARSGRLRPLIPRVGSGPDQAQRRRHRRLPHPRPEDQPLTETTSLGRAASSARGGSLVLPLTPGLEGSYGRRQARSGPYLQDRGGATSDGGTLDGRRGSREQ